MIKIISSSNQNNTDGLKQTRMVNESIKSKPSILSRHDPHESETSTTKSTPMLGTAQLSLPNHPALVSGCVGTTCYPHMADVKLILTDGELSANSTILASISPYLKKLLQEAWTDDDSHWVRDEYPMISLPDVSKHQMGLLLSLL